MVEERIKIDAGVAAEDRYAGMSMVEERVRALSDAVDDLIKRMIKLEQRVYSLEREMGRSR